MHGQIVIKVCTTRHKVFAVRPRGCVCVPMDIEVTHTILGVLTYAGFASSGYTGCPINCKTAAPFDVETH